MLGGNFICGHDFDMDRCPRCFRLYDRTMMYIFIDAQKTIQCAWVKQKAVSLWGTGKFLA